MIVLTGNAQAWKLRSITAFSLFMLGLGASTQGCAADSGQPETPADEELRAAAKKLVGAYTSSMNAGSARLTGLILMANGTFTADVDSGARCMSTQCESLSRFEGKFTATASTLTLSAQKSGDPAMAFHGTYTYVGTTKSLELRRSDWAASWRGSLARQASYCLSASDCAPQTALARSCATTSFTCSIQNTCSVVCNGPADILPGNALRIEGRSSGGGFAPPAPAGSTCALGQTSYALDLQTRIFTWSTCDFTAPDAPLALTSGTRTITNAELGRLERAARQSKISSANICGADKPLVSVTVQDPSGSKTYLDDFYSCQKNGTYLENIDVVMTALRQLIP
jgi:hypothetical protein